jgi:hypothetical protein
MFRFHYLNDEAIIDVANCPSLHGNANGPSLIVAPHWLDNPPGKYLLYFAHHEGQSIRLATSANLTGPWHIYPKNPLELADSCFAISPPADDDLHPEARDLIVAGADGHYPHIASPDVWVDHEKQQIRLYYHGRLKNGLQRSRVALSRNGLDFNARDEILAMPYLRLFKHQQWFYAIAWAGQLYRSRDGISDFDLGPQLSDEPLRHHAILEYDGQLFFFWSRVGDSPECILVSRIDTEADWRQWKLGKSIEVHRPRKPWEGADRPTRPSVYGSSMLRVNELRDPAIFKEKEKIYLLFSIAGEQGIAIGELKAQF